MKNAKQTVRLTFAIVSFVISIALFIYAVAISVSFVLEYSGIKSNIDTGGTDFLLLGLVDGAVAGITSLIGFAFSVLSAVLFRSKPMKIIAGVLACVFIVLIFIGFNLWRKTS